MVGAIYGRLLKNNDIKVIQDFISLLEDSGVNLVIYEGYYAHLVNRIKFKSPVKTLNSIKN